MPRQPRPIADGLIYHALNRGSGKGVGSRFQAIWRRGIEIDSRPLFPPVEARVFLCHLLLIHPRRRNFSVGGVREVKEHNGRTRLEAGLIRLKDEFEPPLDTFIIAIRLEIPTPACAPFPMSRDGLVLSSRAKKMQACKCRIVEAESFKLVEQTQGVFWMHGVPLDADVSGPHLGRVLFTEL